MVHPFFSYEILVNYFLERARKSTLNLTNIFHVAVRLFIKRKLIEMKVLLFSGINFCVLHLFSNFLPHIGLIDWLSVSEYNEICSCMS